MDPSLSARLQVYYNSQTIRLLISTIYILNQVALTMYLLFIPIQIAYFWLLVQIDNGNVQVIIDVCVLIFFLLHVILYLDQKLYEWMKCPYLKWYRKILSIQIIYDLCCVFLAIYAIIIVNKNIKQRLLQIIFIGKIYKLIKFDIKCMYIVVGTWFYPIYKILRTLLILVMVISYVGSLFYGIAYYLYTINIQYIDLLWIVDTGAISDCVQQPFQIQLEYAMYWALGTASTAAYGDISASQPTLILINILALAFEGFLFGFYLNSMHSIPNQNKQKQADLLQQFDSFQHHASNRRISKKLYLQILCSLQYSSSQKRKLNEIQKFLPKKYLQQIKYSIYCKLLNNPIFFNDFDFQMKLAQFMQETVSQMGEDVYDYRGVSPDDLIYVKEGQVETYIQGQLATVSLDRKYQGECFGMFGFVTGLRVPQKALCINYCFFYRVRRQDYKSILPKNLKLQFNMLQNHGFSYQGGHFRRQAVVKFVQNISQSESKLILLYNPVQKQRRVLSIYKQSISKRKLHQRCYNTKINCAVSKTNKMYIPKNDIKFKNAETQTDEDEILEIERVEEWGKSWNDKQLGLYF